jgi:HAD superfamily hydrolase (TIGR01509 family)
VSPQPVARILFIDDGGVMNDNSIRVLEWQRLVGEFMPTRLGGRPDQWSEANRIAFPPVSDALFARIETFPSHTVFQREYDLAWLRSMCEHIGISLPPEAEALAIAREASLYITARARSAYPGAAGAIRALHDAGYELHTASGEASWELDGYLAGMGVRDCFQHLFGPDMVDVMKAGPEYYRRAFARASVDPANALVIDDSEQVCAWAREAGAAVVRIGVPVDGIECAASLAGLADRILG